MLNIIIKYIINFEVHFVGYLNIMDLMNARKMKGTKIITNSITPIFHATY